MHVVGIHVYFVHEFLVFTIVFIPLGFGLARHCLRLIT